MKKITCLFCMFGILTMADFVNTATVRFQLSARGLIPKEARESDLPDPFVKVSLSSWPSDQEIKSEVINNDQFPQWSKVFELNYREGDEIHVIVQEEDGGGGKDGVIGEVDVGLYDLDKEVERDIVDFFHHMIGGRLRFENVQFLP